MLWIDKTELDNFAQTTTARSRMPRLIADLILAVSDPPDVLRFVADAAGEVRGFDGVLVSKGAPPYVPEGKSYWEFGCDKDVAKKASRDLKKRSSEVDDLDQKDAVLVLVNPRHYDTPRKKKDRFEQELKSGTSWKEVRLLDGGELKHWLQQAPGVAARWARREMGAYPAGVRSIDDFWEAYQSRFDIPISEDLLLAGRKHQCEEVVRRLIASGADRIAIAADSPDEALAFAAAAVRTASPDVKLVINSRCIVVDTEEAARDLRNKPLRFFPTGAAADLAGLLSQWGPTIVPIGRYDAPSTGIKLEKSPRYEFAKALESTSVTSIQAAQVTSECGRSVTILARRRPSGRAPSPAWSTTSVLLLPALLVGAWDSDNTFDREVLTKLAGVPDYDTWQAGLQPFLRKDDSLLDYEKSFWKVRAPVDALMVLGQAIGATLFDKLRDVCLGVFGELDTNIGKSNSELMVAQSGLKHSSWLREGLANTLLLISTMGQTAGLDPALDLRGGHLGWVESLISELPGLASDTNLLVSLGRQLPLLAEAAPLPFVSAIEALVRERPDDVRALFVEKTVFVTPVAQHIDLLWSLETLAWDATLLPRVIALLTKLARLDPGGKLGNRPIRSLREILLPWFPGTSANLAVRIGCLEAVVRLDKSVGWDLTISLLPQHHAVSDMTARPRYREANLSEIHPTWDDVHTFDQASVRLMLELVGSDPEKWITVIDRLHALSAKAQTQALQQLTKQFALFDLAQRDRVWKEADRLYATHTSLSDADWTLKGDRLAEIGLFVAHWKPDDAILSATLLYDDDGYFSRPTSLHQAQSGEDLNQLRLSALRVVLAREGEAGLFKLVMATVHAWMVGRDLSSLITTPKALELCRSGLRAGNDRMAEFAVALSAARAMEGQTEWQSELKHSFDAGHIDASSTATLLLGLPGTIETWNFAEALGSNVRQEYWLKRGPRRPDADTGQTALHRSIEEYLQVGRSWTALVALSEAQHPEANLAFRTLDAAVEDYNKNFNPDGGMGQYRVEKIFEALQNRDDVERHELARREFAYLPFLVGPGSKNLNLALFDIISREPSFYVDLLKLVFRSSNAEPVRLTSAETARATAAHNVLQAFKVVPGFLPGQSDVARLHHWVDEVLRLTDEADRTKVGAQYVGRVLAHAPIDGVDGAWPIVPVRDAIDRIGSDELETGIAIERFNMRGVFSKALYEGGKQEREFSSQARRWQETCLRWPRTSAMLSRIAFDWERHADRADVEARQALMQD